MEANHGWKVELGALVAILNHTLPHWITLVIHWFFTGYLAPTLSWAARSPPHFTSFFHWTSAGRAGDPGRCWVLRVLLRVRVLCSSSTLLLHFSVAHWITLVEEFSSIPSDPKIAELEWRLITYTTSSYVQVLKLVFLLDWYSLAIFGRSIGSIPGITESSLSSPSPTSWRQHAKDTMVKQTRQLYKHCDISWPFQENALVTSQWAHPSHGGSHGASHGHGSSFSRMIMASLSIKPKQSSNTLQQIRETPTCIGYHRVIERLDSSNDS